MVFLAVASVTVAVVMVVSVVLMDSADVTAVAIVTVIVIVVVAAVMTVVVTVSGVVVAVVTVGLLFLFLFLLLSHSSSICKDGANTRIAAFAAVVELPLSLFSSLLISLLRLPIVAVIVAHCHCCYRCCHCHCCRKTGATSTHTRKNNTHVNRYCCYHDQHQTK